MFTVSGSFDYHYKPHGSDEPLKVEKFVAGEMVFTPPMEDHACVFTEDCLLVAVSRNPRGDQETYENDVVRTVLVDPDNLEI